jgi:hypothetical protein
MQTGYRSYFALKSRTAQILAGLLLLVAFGAGALAASVDDPGTDQYLVVIFGTVAGLVWLRAILALAMSGQRVRPAAVAWTVAAIACLFLLVAAALATRLTG